MKGSCMGNNLSDSNDLKTRVDFQPKRGYVDGLLDSYLSKGAQPVLFSVVLLTVLGIVSWPIKFFKLTEDDRMKAGIYLGREGATDKPENTNPSSS
jgi:hypothetical protein